MGNYSSETKKATILVPYSSAQILSRWSQQEYKLHGCHLKLERIHCKPNITKSKP